MNEISSKLLWKINNQGSVFLDWWRAALLAQAVVLGHAGSYFGVFDILNPPYFPHVQSLAVQMFFVLSGFLICYSAIHHLNRGDYRLRDFFMDRFCRIYAAFVPALIFVVIIDGVFKYFYPSLYYFEGGYNLGTALKNLLMLQKFPIAEITTPMFGTGSTWWSLSIEWWLYMFFGWILLGKGRFYWLVASVLSIYPVSLALRGQGGVYGVGYGASMVWFVGVMLFGLLQGSLVFDLSRHKIKIFVFSVFFFVVAVFRYISTMQAYDMLAAILLSVGFLLLLTFFQNVSFSFPRLIKHSGMMMASFSFTLFLTHYSFMEHAYRLGFSGWNGFLTTVVISNVFAYFFAQLGEVHYRKINAFISSRVKLLGKA